MPQKAPKTAIQAHLGVCRMFSVPLVILWHNCNVFALRLITACFLTSCFQGFKNADSPI
jgi:hypothetical protein